MSLQRMAISYPYKFLRLNPKPEQNIAFNNQIKKHVSSQQTDTLLRQYAETSSRVFLDQDIC